ncbi:GTP 3',8-cyclase MoaA [Chondrinema litorale]|uniref:GTP 3',8-cyclase MoaA n=1 Tax=Chondrinema litorale TaxID=2994555 RepID=UPI002544BF6E|nr:GTP 3',8-cyclase MoaA [Chondrinema litorale]UZR95100.1 GTP 3',8-cyclase MoaA [Chondrinema litorale]
MKITDNYNRPIEYMRLAVTDRCNLRCFYCMPEEGIKYLPKKELLTYEEMERLVRISSEMGVNKVRITGGEPFVRRGLIEFLERIRANTAIEKINITTNGVLTKQYIPQLKALGITDINLSIDTLDRDRFFQITRRDELPKVMDTLYEMLDEGFKVKINAVVMEGKNTEDIYELAKFTEKHPVEVRFIEEMPFNGEGSHYPVLNWNFKKILEELTQHFPAISKLPTEKAATAVKYQIPGYAGNIGIIAAFTRTFCGSCNRIRLTAQGTLKTCLYDSGVLDLRKILRSEADDETIKTALIGAFKSRAKDGYEAEKNRSQDNKVSESMSTIGG